LLTALARPRRAVGAGRSAPPQTRRQRPWADHSGPRTEAWRRARGARGRLGVPRQATRA